MNDHEMKKKFWNALAAAAVVSGLSWGMSLSAEAADIQVLPIDRAKLWQGQQFDFEVEVKDAVGLQDIQVTIDGKDAGDFFGKTGEIKSQGGITTYSIKNAAFPKTGTYTVEAAATDTLGTSKSAAAYTVVQEKAQKKAKNVILFVGDGMSMQAKEVARILSKGITEGKYNGLLAMETMPHMALITTSGYDSLVTDSANSASAYATGNKSVVNAMGVYANSTPDPLDDPKVENISEILKRTKGMSIGLVSTANITDATPAAMAAHTRRRAEQNFIAQNFLAEEHRPDVILGGGARQFIPMNIPGSKRKDNVDVIAQFKEAGFQFVENKTQLEDAGTDKPILGLFHMDNMNVYVDRAMLKNPNVLKGFTDQPGLVDMTKKAISRLEKNPNGFFAMIEGASIDKQLHVMDWQRAAYDTIEFDKAIEYAKEYSKAHGDNTLIIVVADHGHGISITGTYHENDGKTGTEAVRTYQNAGWPTFEDADRDGFPDNPDPDVTLAVQYANHPAHYVNYRFNNVPTPPALSENGRAIPNPARSLLGDKGEVMPGNIPADETQEVHSADDVVLMAQGPGSEYFNGVMDNTEVFFGMLRALGVEGNKNIK